MKEETHQNLISIADKLYREKNPQGTMCTPNSVYITVVEKWYPKYLESQTDLNFYNWCNKTYGNTK
jgi:hypothetical protein